MDVNGILQIVSLLVSGGIVGQIFFYNSRKRKEEAAAQKDEDENVRAYAAEWKELYEHEHSEHLDERGKLNGKIDQLYEDINRLRTQVRQLKDDKNTLVMRTKELEWNECRVNGCVKRQPPRDYGKEETD